MERREAPGRARDAHTGPCEGPSARRRSALADKTLPGRGCESRPRGARPRQRDRGLRLPGAPPAAARHDGRGGQSRDYKAASVSGDNFLRYCTSQTQFNWWWVEPWLLKQRQFAQEYRFGAPQPYDCLPTISRGLSKASIVPRLWQGLSVAGEPMSSTTHLRSVSRPSQRLRSATGSFALLLKFCLSNLSKLCLKPSLVLIGAAVRQVRRRRHRRQSRPYCR